jgi:hypothetical protein
MNMNEIRFNESHGRIKLRGHVRIFELDNPENVIFDDHNVIVQPIKSVFARLLFSNTEPLSGIWGLALGLGDPNWAPETQPDATPVQFALISELIRKQLSSTNFVDTNGNPTTNFTNQVNFQTIINATTDNIQNSGIRELGLIGGGSKSAHSGAGSNMLTAPYWNPNVTNGPTAADSVTLCTYRTTPPLILPPGVNFAFSWVLSF